MHHSKASIIATLSYSDVFDYPLTKAELWRYLLVESPISFIEFEKTINDGSISQRQEYFFLPGKGTSVARRQQREKVSAKKMQKAKAIVAILQKIPTIQHIGISGSLAMQNAEKDADIDLFVITLPHTLWVTRFFILLLLQLKHVRRKRNERKTRDTVCVNMMIDLDHLAFPKERHDLYTAHEIMQMKPLFSRGVAYEMFLQNNSWVKRFLPNSFPQTALQMFPRNSRIQYSRLQIFENIAKQMQLWYMKRHMTTETIKDGFVAFHPNDYKSTVLNAWEKRKQKYEI